MSGEERIENQEGEGEETPRQNPHGPWPVAQVYHPPYRKGMRGHPCDLIIADVAKRVGARRLCDLGCGNGRDGLQLIRAGLADFVWGIDNGCEPHNSRIHLTKNMIPSDVAGRLVLVEGDVFDAEAMVPNDIQLCYTNNVLEHIHDPDALLRLSLKIAPLALHVVPCERHGWCADHVNSWTAIGFRKVMARSGKVLELGLLEDPTHDGCKDEACPHLNMYALIGRM